MVKEQLVVKMVPFWVDHEVLILGLQQVDGQMQKVLDDKGNGAEDVVTRKELKQVREAWRQPPGEYNCSKIPGT